MTKKKHYTKAGSLRYAEAGARMRQSRARLLAARDPETGARLGRAEHKVAEAVWELTASYSKAWDEVYVDGLAELTELHRRTVRSAIKRLAAAGVIEWRPTQWKHRPSLVGLPALEDSAREASSRASEGAGETPSEPQLDELPRPSDGTSTEMTAAKRPPYLEGNPKPSHHSTPSQEDGEKSGEPETDYPDYFIDGERRRVDVCAVEWAWRDGRWSRVFEADEEGDTSGAPSLEERFRPFHGDGRGDIPEPTGDHAPGQRRRR